MSSSASKARPRGVRSAARWLAGAGCVLTAGALAAQAPAPQLPPTPARVLRTIADLGMRPVFVDVSVGDVEVTGGPRSDLAVDLRRTGGDALPLVVDDTPDGVRISALQAQGGTDASLRAAVSIQAPAGVRFASIRITDGRLTLDGLGGEVDVHVEQGGVRARRVTGRLRLETGIGDVDVEQAVLSADGLIRLRAFNGHVTLNLARRPADARILALVLNGDITSDIPLARKDRFGPRFAEATLGRGEPVISIDVVTGTIAIKAPKD